MFFLCPLRFQYSATRPVHRAKDHVRPEVPSSRFAEDSEFVGYCRFVSAPRSSAFLLPGGDLCVVIKCTSTESRRLCWRRSGYALRKLGRLLLTVA